MSLDGSTQSTAVFHWVVDIFLISTLKLEKFIQNANPSTYWNNKKLIENIKEINETSVDLDTQEIIF